jgi:hypothetical protein
MKPGNDLGRAGLFLLSLGGSRLPNLPGASSCRLAFTSPAPYAVPLSTIASRTGKQP